MNFALPDMANQQHCISTFADVSSRSRATATTADSSIGFVEEYFSTTFSPITFEEDLLPPASRPLPRLSCYLLWCSHQQQKRLSDDVSLADVESLMDSFGERRKVTRFSGSSEGGLDKPCSSPKRMSSVEDVKICSKPQQKRFLGRNWKTNSNYEEVEQPCSMPQRKPSLCNLNYRY